ncbi:Lrp/AsnC family transcriptional regulator [Mucilaginibacter sp. RS28]|uniref:Lrp/AsnC family transcriptional regulator n=1 Tax=Mucilaginibacter straminoryzae TaxID=2932774 RepID=A0A9X1WZ67_9SPHI|nr:Lrp/AsnC family transcriptional regulator [Mucilaginibacter straminoryzae]MCJ8208224.1 Lrp/AsnC family transcriptional regulator [Mucilaginibacter straminoryzae]
MLSKLDQTDLQILQLLQQNARLTNKEIGERLNKTATPIYERIKRLQEQGYIKGYVAVLDHKKVDRGLMAFTHIQLKDHSNEALCIFVEQMARFDEVLECYQMSGEYDFILRVAVKDLDTYHDFLVNKVFKVVPLGSVQTTFVLKETKRETAFPLIGTK